MGESVDQDKEHLKILSIVYYVLAGLSALGSLFGLLYIVLGAFFAKGTIPASSSSHQEFDQETFGTIFIVVGALFFFVALGGSLLQFLTARWLGKRKNRTFCFVIAVIHLLSIPLGTILGIFTIIVLSRDSVKKLFENGEPDFEQNRAGAIE